MSQYHEDDDEMIAELECWDLDDFLNATPINEDIYDRIMIIRKVSNLDLDPEKMFRACYYQLYCAYTDAHPELLFDDGYEQTLHEALNPYEAEISHCMMKTLLDLQSTLPKQVKRYYTQLVITANKHGSVNATFEKLVMDKKAEGKVYPIDFEYLEFGVELPEDITTADWYTLTHGYQERYIEKFVEMGQTEKEQKTILIAIHARYKPYCHQHHDVFNSDDPLHGYFENQLDLIKIRFMKKKQAVTANPAPEDSVEVTALKEKIAKLESMLEEQDADSQGNTLKCKTLVILDMLKKLDAGLSKNDMTKISKLVSYLTAGNAKKLYNYIHEGIVLTDYHDEEIKRVNAILKDLNLNIKLQKG